MNEVKPDNQKKMIVKTIEKITPYMPPVLEHTEYIWFDGTTLYMLTDSMDTVYHDRLSTILKEEFSFVQDIKFILRRE